MNAVGLLEACRDRELLNLQPWPRQAEILKAIDSGRYREVILAPANGKDRIVPPESVCASEVESSPSTRAPTATPMPSIATHAKTAVLVTPGIIDQGTS